MAAAEPITDRELNRATLARQTLLAREKLTPVKAAERLAGLQAQEPRPPFVGLWTRIDGFDPAAVHRALARHDLVRGTLMRATLHLASARDYAAFRPVLQPVLTGAMETVLKTRRAVLDLDAVHARGRELLAERPRTFNDLRAALLEDFAKADHRAMGYAVRMALPLVMVPSKDRWGFPRDAEFAPAETWLDLPAEPDPDPAPLVRRYLAAFGPASAADVQTWSGLKRMKAVLDGMRDELVAFTSGRRELFDLPDAPRPGADADAPVRFLPEFDNLLLGHADRARVIADEHRPRVFTKNLRILATFLVDGVVAGTWAVERKGKAATLRLTPFAKLPRAAAKELDAEGEPLLALLEPDAATRAVALGKP